MPEGSLGWALLAFSHYQTQNIGVGMIATMAWFKIGRVTDRNLGAHEVSVSLVA